MKTIVITSAKTLGSTISARVGSLLAKAVEVKTVVGVKTDAAKAAVVSTVKAAGAIGKEVARITGAVALIAYTLPAFAIGIVVTPFINGFNAGNRTANNLIERI